jgi:hypothetical protein
MPSTHVSSNSLKQQHHKRKKSHDIVLFSSFYSCLDEANSFSNYKALRSFKSISAPSTADPLFLSEDIADHALHIEQIVTPLYDSFPSRARASTEPIPFRVVHDEMTTFSHPPGSPPELTSSKSSKSSSLATSTADGVLTDLSHFEDIGLEDDHTNGPNYSRNKALTGPSGSSTSIKTSILPTSSSRELVNGSTRSITQANGSGNVQRHGSPLSLTLPNGLRKTNTSPSLGANGYRSNSQSRSPSPTHLNQRPVSPRRMQRIPSNEALRNNSSASLQRARRESATRMRKTAKEIEAEFHDSDDDLPDDASLWNVPLSPGLFRTASSAANSANASASTSPERPSYLSTSPNLSHLRSSKTTPMPSKPFPPVLESGDVSPISPRLPRGVSTGGIDTFTFGKARAKSWSNVLSDLSEDAMALSEALDAHANESERRGQGGFNFKESPLDKRRVKSSIVELPPLRRNNVMIDPLPISKEKEKVLSRTRPSWLPPKNQKEEKKHLKEYQKMMEASLEAGMLKIEFVHDLSNLE